MAAGKEGSASRVAAALAVTMTLWASAFVIIKSAGATYGAGELALLRFTTAGVALTIYAIIARAKLPRRRDVPWFFMTGLLGVALYHPFLNYGEHVVSAGAASLLMASAPVWAAVFAFFALREKVSIRKALGIAVSFAGIALLVLGSNGSFAIDPAAFFVVASAICAALYVIVQKKYLAGYSALEFTLWTVWGGVILLLPVFGIQTVQQTYEAPLRATCEVLYLGVFPGAIAYMTFAFATVRMPAATVMSFMYLIPALAMLMAWPYLGEVPTALSLIGGALAIGGVAIVNTPKRPPDASA